MKTITVVIASYRYGHLAAQAIESVLAQTRPADKILFVDDGVGDCRHLHSIYGAGGCNIDFIFREQNIGTVANFQDMLEMVETDRCMFLGADNYLRPDTLEMLDAEDADIVSYDWAIIGTERHVFNARLRSEEIVDGYIIHRFSKGNIENGNYIHGSSLYDTKKAQAVGYKASGNARTEEDWMLFKGMLQNGATHTHVPESMLYYRRHKSNFNPNS